MITPDNGGRRPIGKYLEGGDKGGDDGGSGGCTNVVVGRHQSSSSWGACCLPTATAGGVTSCVGTTAATTTTAAGSDTKMTAEEEEEMRRRLMTGRIISSNPVSVTTNSSPDGGRRCNSDDDEEEEFVVLEEEERQSTTTRMVTTTTRRGGTTTTGTMESSSRRTGQEGGGAHEHGGHRGGTMMTTTEEIHHEHQQRSGTSTSTTTPQASVMAMIMVVFCLVSVNRFLLCLSSSSTKNGIRRTMTTGGGGGPPSFAPSHIYGTRGARRRSIAATTPAAVASAASRFILLLGSTTTSFIVRAQQQAPKLPTVTPLRGRECHPHGCSSYPPEMMVQDVYKALQALRTRHSKNPPPEGKNMGEGGAGDDDGTSTTTKDDEKKEEEDMGRGEKEEGHSLLLKPIAHVLSMAPSWELEEEGGGSSFSSSGRRLVGGNDEGRREEDTTTAEEELSSSSSSKNGTTFDDHGYDDGEGAILTLVGFKGGPMQSQINQDRAVIVSPFRIHSGTEGVDDNGGDADEKQNDFTSASSDKIIDPVEDEVGTVQSESRDLVDGSSFLVGVFDGHGTGGEIVSQYVTMELPKVLSHKLASLKDDDTSSAPMEGGFDATGNWEKEKKKDRKDLVTEALTSTFLHLDTSIPNPQAAERGGCTASVVYHERLHPSSSSASSVASSTLYVANAGDSRSFIVTFDTLTNTADVVYATREDKPDLPDERARVESRGGQVYYTGATSRVLGIDPTNGSQYGLAMSRSIGDWSVGRLGVIPDPIVKVLDVERDVIEPALRKRTEAKTNSENGDGDTPQCYMGGGQQKGSCPSSTASVGGAEKAVADGGDGDYSNNGEENRDRGIRVFVVSATDGLLDFIQPEVLVNHVGKSLFAADTAKKSALRLAAEEEGEGDKESKRSPPEEEGSDDLPSHPLIACEDLVVAAARAWSQAHSNSYRDDIAIAVKEVPVPY